MTLVQGVIPIPLFCNSPIMCFLFFNILYAAWYRVPQQHFPVLIIIIIIIIIII